MDVGGCKVRVFDNVAVGAAESGVAAMSSPVADGPPLAGGAGSERFLKSSATTLEQVLRNVVLFEPS